MFFIIRLIVSAFALLLVAHFVPGIEISGLYPAVVSALVLGLLNAIVRPILVVLTLPITIVTLGIFIFIINAALFLFVASFVEGFTVDSFWIALVGSILVSVINSIVNKFI